MRHALLSLAIAFSLTGCPSPQRPLEKVAEDARAVVPPTPDAGPKAAPPKATAPTPKARPATKAGPKELTAEEKTKAKTYLVALQQGRSASAKGDLAGAAKHFTDALVAVPSDPTALGERGYVRIKLNQIDDALADLRLAAGTSARRAVAAAIWYNLSLAEKAKGNDAAAVKAAERSKAIRAGAPLVDEDAPRVAAMAAPKAAAPATPARPAPPAPRLQYGARCPATGKRVALTGSNLATWADVARWYLAFHKRTFSEDHPEQSAAGEGEAAIRKAMDLDEGNGPWLVVSAGDNHRVWHLLVAFPKGGFRVFEALASKQVGRCSVGVQSVTYERTSRDLRIVAIEVVQDYVFMCRLPDGSIDRCKEVEGEQPMQSACFNSAYSVTTTFFDIGNGLDKVRGSLEITESGSLKEEEDAPEKGRVTFTSVRDGIEVKGAGCQGKVPYPL